VPLLKPAGLDVKYTLAPAGSQKPGWNCCQSYKFRSSWATKMLDYTEVDTCTPKVTFKVLQQLW